MVDDTRFAKDGPASPCVARQDSGTLGKIGNCQVGVSVHLVSEHASCAADWRLSCPESWDDAALADPVEAARAARRRERAGIPGEVRHAEKWRLALEMIDEMASPGGWGVLEQVTAGWRRAYDTPRQLQRRTMMPRYVLIHGRRTNYEGDATRRAKRAELAREDERSLCLSSRRGTRHRDAASSPLS